MSFIKMPTKDDLAWSVSAGLTGLITGGFLLSDKAPILGGLYALDNLLSKVVKPHFDKKSNSLAPFVNDAGRMVLIVGGFRLLGLGAFPVTLSKVSVLATAILGGALGKWAFQYKDNAPRVVEALSMATMTGCALDLGIPRTSLLVSIYAIRAITQLANPEAFHHYDSGLQYVGKASLPDFVASSEDKYGFWNHKFAAIKVNTLPPLLFLSLAGLISTVASGIFSFRTQ